MNFPFFCHNIALLSGCVWTPPTGNITAELIWRETEVSGGVPTRGTVGVDQTGRIIAYTARGKIITSTDYGDSWTEYPDSCPPSVVDPVNHLLIPSVFQYSSGWKVQLRDTEANAANTDNGNFLGTFSGGVFTYGSWNDERGLPPTYPVVGFRNNRYSNGSAVWDGAGVVVGGRWGTNSANPGADIPTAQANSLAVARYTSIYGSNMVPGDYSQNLMEGNCYGLFKIQEGWCLIRFNGSTGTNWRGQYFNDSFTETSSAARSSPTTGFGKQVTNGIKTVMRPHSVTTIARWFKETDVPPTWTNFNPNCGQPSGGETLAGFSPKHWLYAVGTTNRLYTSYTVDVDGIATPIRGPQVILPATISSSGSNGNLQWIQYAGNGWWVGYYVRTVDNKLDIYRFRYGTYTGDCFPSYICSSYQDWLLTLSATYLTGSKTAGWAMKLTGDAGGTPWPWSTSTGADGKHIFYGNYGSTPVPLSNWATGTPDTTYVCEDQFSENITDAVFCNGTPSSMGALHNALTTGYPKAIIPAAATANDQLDAWGDWYLEALIMEHDIGNGSLVMNGNMMRHCGKNWTWTREGAPSSTRSDNLRVSATCNSVGDVTITMICNGDTNAGANSSASFTVPGAAAKLGLFQAHMSTGIPYEKQSTLNNLFYVVRDCVIRCWFNGVYGELRAIEWVGGAKSNSQGLSNITPWTTIGNPTRLYSYPQSFDSNRCNVASYASGKLDLSLVDTVQQAGLLAWKNNTP